MAVVMRRKGRMGRTAKPLRWMQRMQRLTQGRCKWTTNRMEIARRRRRTGIRRKRKQSRRLSMRRSLRTMVREMGMGMGRARRTPMATRRTGRA